MYMNVNKCIYIYTYKHTYIHYTCACANEYTHLFVHAYTLHERTHPYMQT